MKILRVIAALVFISASVSCALSSMEPIPKPAQSIEKAIELARKEIGKTDASEYIMMMAIYSRPADFAMQLPEEYKTVVKKLQPNEYSWFIEMRHPAKNDQSVAMIVKRDDKVEVLWNTY